MNTIEGHKLLSLLKLAGGWRLRCECGWRVAVAPRKTDAIAAWNEHRASIGIPHPETLTIEEIARKIKEPVAEWSGNCFAIATKMVDARLVAGRTAYGHWTGPISPQSIFANRRGVGFTHHGWIVLNDGRVCDPTRWVFEAKEPYLYLGDRDDFTECHDFESATDLGTCIHCGHLSEEHRRGFFRPCLICAWPYDEGGQGVLAAMMQPCPVWSKKAAMAEPLRLTKKAQEHLTQVMGRAAGPTLTKDQLFWIANLPIRMLHPYAREIYRAIEKTGRGAIIPIDNARMAKVGALA